MALGPRMATGSGRCFQRRFCHSRRRRYVSKLFQNFGKLQPAETGLSCKSHKLMVYNEIICQSHTGSFHILPLGMRALKKLIYLIEEEMDAIGAQRLNLTTITPGLLWQKSGRWNMPELFRLKDRHQHEFCLGPTHEEAITDFMATYAPVSNSRLPLMLYQITKKYRDEIAPKNGLLRGKEFDMKDLYTFDNSNETAQETYKNVCDAYARLFKRLQVPFFKVEGSTGNIGGEKSHEFHFLADVGEDRLLLCKTCGLGVNKELMDADSFMKHQCDSATSSPELEEMSGIEVGHAFLLGSKYSAVFKAFFKNKSNMNQPLEMGCYGLGLTRILQASLEVLSTDRRIRWPSLIAPYQVCIIPQKEGYKSDICLDLADTLSDMCTKISSLCDEVVIDDRIHLTVGKRLYEANRIGYPYIIILGKKSLLDPPEFEVIQTATGQTMFLSMDAVYDIASQIQTI